MYHDTTTGSNAATIHQNSLFVPQCSRPHFEKKQKQNERNCRLYKAACRRARWAVKSSVHAPVMLDGQNTVETDKFNLSSSSKWLANKPKCSAKSVGHFSAMFKNHEPFLTSRGET